MNVSFSKNRKATSPIEPISGINNGNIKRLTIENTQSGRTVPVLRVSHKRCGEIARSVADLPTTPIAGFRACSNDIKQLSTIDGLVIRVAFGDSVASVYRRCQ